MQSYITSKDITAILIHDSFVIFECTLYITADPFLADYEYTLSTSTINSNIRPKRDKYLGGVLCDEYGYHQGTCIIHLLSDGTMKGISSLSATNKWFKVYTCYHTI